jgi:hypothetical protein
MDPILILDTPRTFVGLGSFSFTVPSAGPYYVLVQSTELPSSSISFSVTQNGTPIYTSPSLSSAQQEFQFKLSMNCAMNDALVVSLSSSNPNDAQLNTVKSLILIGEGQ